MNSSFDLCLISDWGFPKTCWAASNNLNSLRKGNFFHCGRRTGFGGGGAFGLPLRGGKAGTADAGKYAAFNRKVETVSVFSPICNIKKRNDRSKTR
jgi:hypothetical protein